MRPILIMRNAGGGGGGGGGGSGAVVTWNPADSSSSLIFSGGNLTVTHDVSGNHYVSGRATNANPSGKAYFEVYMSAGGSAPGILVGVADTAGILGNYAGVDSHAYTYYADTGYKYHSGSIAYGATYASGDVVGVAYDAGTGSNGTIEFLKNNVSQGVAFTGLPQGLFPVISFFYGTTAIAAIGRFKSADFSYSPPSGYNPWGI